MGIGYEYPTNMLTWINYGQEMRRRRARIGPYPVKQGYTSISRMELYIQEAKMHRRWRQGLCYQRQIEVQCNFPSIVMGLTIRLRSCNISIRNFVVREGQGGVHLLGTSKASYQNAYGLRNVIVHSQSYNKNIQFKKSNK